MKILLMGSLGLGNDIIGKFAAENRHELRDTPEITSVKKFMKAAERANEYDFVILDIYGYDITDEEFEKCVSRLVQQCDSEKIIVYAPSASKNDSRVLSCTNHNINKIVKDYAISRAKNRFVTFTSPAKRQEDEAKSQKQSAENKGAESKKKPQPNGNQQPVVQAPPAQEVEQPVVQAPPVQEAPQPVVQKPPVQEAPQPVVQKPPVQEAPQPVVQKPPVQEAPQPVVQKPPVQEAPQPVVQMPPVQEAPQPVVQKPLVQETPKPVVQKPPVQNEQQTTQPQSVQWGQTVQSPVISKPPIQESQQPVIPKIPTREVQKPVIPNTQVHTAQQPVQTPQMRNDQQTIQTSSQWGQTVQSPVMPGSQTRGTQERVAPAQQGVNLPPGMQGALSQNNNYQPRQQDEFVKTKKIGVLGIMSRIGTTTQAVQLARYFTEAGKTTCYIQCNNSNFIDSMEDFFSDIVRPEGRKSLLYEEIEFYRNRNQSLGQQYEYVVNDFGCIDESGTIPTDFYNCDFRFIVCGGMASEVAALTKVSQALYSDEHLIYLFSFIEEYDREDILDLVSDRRDKVYFVPYTPDCYCRSEESLEMFNSIFHLRETEKKKKKLFGFRRRK